MRVCHPPTLLPFARLLSAQCGECVGGRGRLWDLRSRFLIFLRPFIFFLSPTVSRGSRPPLSFKEAGGSGEGKREKVPVSLLPILILRIYFLGQSRVFPFLFRAARPRPSNSIICAEKKCMCPGWGGGWWCTKGEKIGPGVIRR